MIKKLSLITIISILAYSQVGYYFVLRFQQHKLKQHVKEKIFSGLKEEDLDAIPFAEGIINWKEYGKEFIYNGNMYDVVKTKTINGKLVLYCINDKKEKSLIDHYNLITKHNSTSDNKGKTNFHFPVLFLEVTSSLEIQFNDKHQIFLPYNSRLSESIIDLISPPPRALPVYSLT